MPVSICYLKSYSRGQSCTDPSGDHHHYPMWRFLIGGFHQDHGIQEYRFSCGCTKTYAERPRESFWGFLSYLVRPFPKLVKQ